MAAAHAGRSWHGKHLRCDPPIATDTVAAELIGKVPNMSAGIPRLEWIAAAYRSRYQNGCVRSPNGSALLVETAPALISCPAGKAGVRSNHVHGQRDS